MNSIGMLSFAPRGEDHAVLERASIHNERRRLFAEIAELERPGPGGHILRREWLQVARERLEKITSRASVLDAQLGPASSARARVLAEQQPSL